MSDVKKHTFNQGVDTILGECIAISDQRGNDYEDTWNIKNTTTQVLSHVLRMQGTFDHEDVLLNRRWRRLLIMASLIDVKLSRLLGPYKEDTFIDLINYSACFAFLMRDWEQAVAAAQLIRKTGVTPQERSEARGILENIGEPSVLDIEHVDNVHIHKADGEHWPETSADWIKASHHMLDHHRQDGSPILSHQLDHYARS